MDPPSTRMDADSIETRQKIIKLMFRMFWLLLQTNRGDTGQEHNL